MESQYSPQHPLPGETQATGAGSAPTYAPHTVPAWTAPPQMGLIPLRPLSFGAILGAPFRVFRNNPLPTIGSALVFNLVVMAMLGFGIYALVNETTIRLETAASEDISAIVAGAFSIGILFFVLQFAIITAGSVIIQAITSAEVGQSTLARKRSFAELWSLLRPRLGALLLWTAISVAALIVGMALIVVPLVLFLAPIFADPESYATADVSLPSSAILSFLVLPFVGMIITPLFIWVAVKLLFVPSCIVLEQISLRAAMKRSWSLTNGYFWSTFGTLLLLGIIIQTASSVVSMPLSFLYAGGVSFLSPTSVPDEDFSASALYYLLSGSVSVIFSSISLIATSACTALIYINVRMRKEGLDVQLIQFRERFPATQPVREEPNAYFVPETRPQAPQFGQPQYGQPQAPQYGQPQYGQPQYGQPQAPQYGQPQAPQYGQPQYGQPQPPQYGQPQAPQYGQPQPPQYGQPQYGQPQPHNPTPPS